jgi:hypothetical protein
LPWCTQTAIPMQYALPNSVLETGLLVSNRIQARQCLQGSTFKRLLGPGDPNLLSIEPLECIICGRYTWRSQSDLRYSPLSDRPKWFNT